MWRAVPALYVRIVWNDISVGVLASVVAGIVLWAVLPRGTRLTKSQVLVDPGRRMSPMHGLLELDVTEASRLIAAHGPR